MKHFGIESYKLHCDQHLQKIRDVFKAPRPPRTQGVSLWGGGVVVAGGLEGAVAVVLYVSVCLCMYLYPSVCFLLQEVQTFLESTIAPQLPPGAESGGDPGVEQHQPRQSRVARLCFVRWRESPIKLSKLLILFSICFFFFFFLLTLLPGDGPGFVRC